MIVGETKGLGFGQAAQLVLQLPGAPGFEAELSGPLLDGLLLH